MVPVADGSTDSLYLGCLFVYCSGVQGAGGVHGSTVCQVPERMMAFGQCMAYVC